MSDDPIVVVDLFCGAGGFSTGAALALEELGRTPGEDVELHAVNHWDVAIETHERNHPWAEHYHCGISEVDKSEIAEPGEVDLLIGGPECTHFSTARGGMPVDDQKRMPAWNVLNWIHKLRPKHILLENVGDLRNWGPIEEDGTPSRDGSVYEAWIEAIEAHGYPVIRDGKDRPGIKLTAANYGDPTTRERLFVVASRTRQASVPAPTHSNEDDDLEDWIPAAAVLDWDDLGTSLWTRDRDEPRCQPLKYTTHRRIAEGFRRHCHDALEPFADALEWIGTVDPEEDDVDPDDFRTEPELREEAVPFEDAADEAEAREEPFLVECPEDATVLASPALIRQQDGAHPTDVTDRPVPTISTDGAIGLSTPVTRPLVKPRNMPQRDIHSNAVYPPEEAPLHTVTASNHDGHLVSPFLVDYHGNSDAASIEEPLGAVETRDRYALCVPELWPWGLDVGYRMLKPSELMLAQGFPRDYDLAGTTKGERTEQIGNAVPVGMAKALCKHQLSAADPSLSTFGGGLGDDGAEVPDYSEVASDD